MKTLVGGMGVRDTCDDVTCHELVTRCPRHIWPGSDSDLVLVPPPTLGPGSTGDPGQGNIRGMWENSPGHLLAPGDR